MNLLTTVKETIALFVVPEDKQALSWLDMPISKAFEGTAEVAKLSQVIEIKNRTGKHAYWLALFGWFLLISVLFVSFAHTVITIGTLTPKAITMPDWLHYTSSILFALVESITAVYIFYAMYILKFAQLSINPLYSRFMIGLTFLLNLGYIAKYGNTYTGAFLVPVLQELFIIVLPIYVVVAVVALKKATESLTLASMRLQVEETVYSEVLKSKAS